jgi:hypothetical protein
VRCYWRTHRHKRLSHLASQTKPQFTKNWPHALPVVPVSYLQLLALWLAQAFEAVEVLAFGASPMGALPQGVQVSLLEPLADAPSPDRA